MPHELVCDIERPDDVSAVDQLTIDAFGQPLESQLVQALRTNGGLTLSAVARLAGVPVAHVAYSPVTVGGLTPAPPVLALAPVSVTPAWQRRGYGSELIRWSLERLKDLGHPGVIVLGEPAFYCRFDFRRASDVGILCPFEVPPEYFMALALRPDGLRSTTGLVEYRPEFAAVS